MKASLAGARGGEHSGWFSQRRVTRYGHLVWRLRVALTALGAHTAKLEEVLFTGSAKQRSEMI